MAKVKRTKVALNLTKNKYNLEEELYNSIRIFLIICEIAATAPALIHRQLDPSHIEDGSKFGTIGILRVVHLFWCGTVLTCVLVSTYFQYTEFDTVMPIIQKALYISEYISNSLNVLIVIVGCYRRRMLYRSFFDRLVGIDINLNHFRVPQSPLLLRKLFRLLLISFAVFFTLVLIVDFFYNEMSVKGFFRSSTVYSIPNLITLFALSQYCGLIFTIQIRFSKVNLFLEKKLCSRDSVSDVRKFYEIYRDPLKPNIGFRGTGDSSGLPKVIDAIRILYADLCSLSADVTESFGILILLIFIASFLILSIQIFALYKMLDAENINIFLVCYTLLWIILHLGKMMLVLSANSEMRKEKSKTNFVLDKIEITNQETHFSINRFVLQLATETRVPIVCGVLELDMMVLGTIIGALTSYVIFLIQFDLSTVTLDATTTASNHTNVARNLTVIH